MITDGHQDFQTWQTTLTAYGLAYGFLSKAFHESPQTEFITRLYDEDAFADWPLGVVNGATQTGLQLLQEYGAQWTIDALTEDYRALFIGPGRLLAYPWESVYLSEERLIFDAQTLKVRALYRQYDLQVPQTTREPDDHIGFELAFMVHLCSLGLVACQSRDAAGLARSLEAQRGFLREHLLRWTPAFFQAVINNARTDYYRGTAYLGLGTIETAAAMLDATAEAAATE
jgi:TorA maturation chaperone TorD